MMASRTFIRRSIGVVLIVVALIAQAMASFFAQELIAEAAILAIFALSLDLLATCGLISFGHAGLLGVGCYVFAGVTVLMGGSPNVAFPVGDRSRSAASHSWSGCSRCARPARSSSW